MKDGWAYHKCKEITGSYPHKKVAPIPPNEEVAGKIKHLQIKWARAKGKDSGGSVSRKQTEKRSS